MQRLSCALLLCLAAWGAPASAVTVAPVSGLREDFMMGADVSMLAQIEHNGGHFADAQGQRGDALQILKTNGVNWVRLRLWHTPVNDSDVIEGGRRISRRGEPKGGGNNDLPTTVRLAQRAKALGLKVLLDIHYSDFWADPNQQNKPAAWANLHGAALEQAVYAYTREVMQRLNQAGALPDMVQVGNELNGGMLWPDGKTWQEKPGETIGGDAGFVALMKQGIRAVREAAPQRIPVVVHLADGGRNELYRKVFDLFTREQVDYDVIGLSFYAYYHGPVEDLQANMDDISARYGKPVAVVETAYAYTSADADGWPNLFNADMVKSVGYQASVQGQTSMVRDVINAVAQVPGQRGLGVFYWEPDWIATPNTGWRTGEGNGRDNQAMFDANGKALPSLAVFKRVREAGSAEQVAANTPQLLPKPIRLNAFAGEAWTPPDSLNLPFTDDAQRKVYVQWEEVPADKLKQVGEFVLGGEVLEPATRLQATVQVTPRRNLLDDPSFEKGTLKGWTLSGDASAASNERNPGNAHSGVHSLHYWKGESFQFEATQSFSGLKAGRYSLKAWASGGGGEKALEIFVKDCGDTPRKAQAMSNTGWQKWKQYHLGGLNVPEGGHCTIGLRVDGVTGNWGNVDDIEFLRED